MHGHCSQIFSFCLMFTPDIRIGPRPVLTHTLSGTFSYNASILKCSLNFNFICHLIFQSNLPAPTFRVQRLSFAFFRETKRSSEMNVSSSTWRQRQWCWRCEKNHMKILTTQPKTPKLNALILLTVIMWLSLPRTQDTDLRKAKFSYVVKFVFRTFRYYLLISRTKSSFKWCERIFQNFQVLSCVDI